MGIRRICLLVLFLFASNLNLFSQPERGILKHNNLSKAELTSKVFSVKKQEDLPKRISQKGNAEVKNQQELFERNIKELERINYELIPLEERKERIRDLKIIRNFLQNTYLGKIEMSNPYLKILMREMNIFNDVLYRAIKYKEYKAPISNMIPFISKKMANHGSCCLYDLTRVNVFISGVDFTRIIAISPFDESVRDSPDYNDYGYEPFFPTFDGYFALLPNCGAEYSIEVQKKEAIFCEKDIEVYCRDMSVRFSNKYCSTQ